jgi:hypothetical protein
MKPKTQPPIPDVAQMRLFASEAIKADLFLMCHKMHQFVSGYFHGNEVIRCLRIRSVRGRVILDTKL